MLHCDSGYAHEPGMSRAKASLLEDDFCAPLRRISAALQTQNFQGIPISGLYFSKTPAGQFPVDGEDKLDEGRFNEPILKCVISRSQAGKL